jgi:hypothetical protein
MVDRGEPEASRSEWHADGTAGENDRGSGLAATGPAQAMGEACPRRHRDRWQASAEARQCWWPNCMGQLPPRLGA